MSELSTWKTSGFYFHPKKNLSTSGLALQLACVLTQAAPSVAAAGCCRRAICGSGDTPAICLLYSRVFFGGFCFVLREGQITVFVAMLCGGFSGLS